MTLQSSHEQQGMVTPALLVTVVVFSIVLYGLANLVANQYLVNNRKLSSEQAVNIAEAGINYYRWHLAHSPDDYTDSTGGPGPYTHDYIDPQGGTEGQYQLTITPPTEGSSIVTITSTGWTSDSPDIKRTITAQYGQPSFAQYAFLHDSNIYLGDGIEIYGPVHSNGGIRQDGINHALVTSSLDTYTCGSETGCSPAQTKPAIWGSGGDQGLWSFPQSPIDFNALSIDFTNMRTSAQSNGLYLNESGQWGYHLVFNSTGTFNLYRVRRTNSVKGYDSDTGCTNLNQIIRQETNLGTYQQSDIPIIFSEDYLWIEGTITSPIEIVAARFPINTNQMDIWINNNIKYQTTDGSIHAGIIAQNDILFIRDLPQNFEINGALLAQKGKIRRHYYGYCESTAYAVRNSLTIYGSVISAQKSYWNWGNTPSSGFTSRNITYDASLRYTPPPYFPNTGEYEFINWTE